MDREQAKALLPIIKAFSEGKIIEYRDSMLKDDWKIVKEIPNLSFGCFEYRIKPEHQYRPFANAQECLEEMKKHVPFSWVKDNCSFYPIELIGTNFSKGWIKCYGIWFTPEQMFKNATFLDGTPFGVKIEEDKQ